jgi:hypothetical protein
MAVWFIFVGLSAALIKERDIYELLGEEDLEMFHSNFSMNIRVLSFYSFNPTGKNELNSLFFQFASVAKKEGLPVTFAKLDRAHQKNKEIAKKLKYQYNHAVYYLVNSTTEHVYRGPKNKDLFDYLLKKVHKVHQFEDLKIFKDFVMKQVYYEGIVLAALGPEDLEIREKFFKFSVEFSHLYAFGIIEYSDGLQEEFGIEKSAIVACRGPGLISFGDVYYKALTNFTEVDLEEWVKTHIFPNIAFVNKEREPLLVSKVPLIKLVVDLKEKDVVEGMIDMLTLYSKHYFSDDFYDRRYRWGIADRNEYLEELQNDGLDHLQMVYYVHDEKNTYVIDKNIYQGHGEFNETGLKHFYSKYPQKQYPPFTKINSLKKFENNLLVAQSQTIYKILSDSETSHLLYVFTEKPTHLKLIEDLASSTTIEIIKLNKSQLKLSPPYTSDQPEYLMILRKSLKSSPELYKGDWSLKKIKKSLKLEDKPNQDL